MALILPLFKRNNTEYWGLLVQAVWRYFYNTFLQIPDLLCKTFGNLWSVIFLLRPLKCIKQLEGQAGLRPMFCLNVRSWDFFYIWDNHVCKGNWAIFFYQTFFNLEYFLSELILNLYLCSDLTTRRWDRRVLCVLMSIAA